MSPLTSTVFLVSCVSAKCSSAAPARDLYLSAWFRKARAWVESHGGRWFILSAAHGLVPPDQIIQPYEKTLKAMPVGERRAWASRVLASLATRLTWAPAEVVVVLAGERYREFLLEPLKALVPRVEVPLAGLGIGEQLAWLNVHARQGTP